MSANRTNRISEEIKREVSDIIQNDLKDPRITGLISVTKAVVTNDMRYAKVYISIMANAEEQKNILQGLKNASGFIRKEIGQRINIRYTPEILFELDDSIEYGIKISNILKQISTDKDKE
ncbi:MAG: 30S ribosome-binding factor RbfA [Ignavibacteriales bacterium]